MSAAPARAGQLLSRVGAVLLAVIAAGLLLLVRLDTTWGHRPFGIEHGAMLAGALLLLAAAVLGWQRPALGWAGLGLFVLLSLMIATKGAAVANWLDAGSDPAAAPLVLPTE